ncbi:MAG: hypothetical protein ACKVYV_00370 [Limisphaerales bacterium]
MSVVSEGSVRRPQPAHSQATCFSLHCCGPRWWDSEAVMKFPARFQLLAFVIAVLSVVPAAHAQILELVSQARSVFGSASVEGFDTESFSDSATDFGFFFGDQEVLAPPSDSAPDSTSAAAAQISGIDEFPPDEAAIYGFGSAYADFVLDNPVLGSSSAVSVFEVGFRVTQPSFFQLYGETYEDVLDDGASGSSLVQLLEDGLPLFTFSGSDVFDVSGILEAGREYRLIGRAEAGAAATGPGSNYSFTDYDVSLDLVAVPEPAACAAAAGMVLVGFGLWRRCRPVS